MYDDFKLFEFTEVYIKHFSALRVNPSPAESFAMIHSFEAGIAKAISSFK